MTGISNCQTNSSAQPGRLRNRPLAGENAENIVRLDSANQRLRESFVKWQCRIRQIAMREGGGKPSDGMMPALRLWQDGEPVGHIISVMNKAYEHSKTPEIRHMVRKTADPKARRDSAIKFFSEYYYQKPHEFADTLTATFPPGSAGAEQILDASRCWLKFEQFNQSYDIACRPYRLGENDPLFQSTFWHNLLFNPALPGDTVILGFEADWAASTANPSPI